MSWETYEEWLEQVPQSITQDGLWKFELYRRALFLSDLAWFDGERLLQIPHGRSIAWQLVDSAGSIAANIEEGFGRGFGKDYARFLRISLGSARETRGWYYSGRHALDPKVVAHRMVLTDEIIAGLVKTADQQRRL
jgi:four helix bundle protein